MRKNNCWGRGDCYEKVRQWVSCSSQSAWSSKRGKFFWNWALGSRFSLNGTYFSTAIVLHVDIRHPKALQVEQFTARDEWPREPNTKASVTATYLNTHFRTFDADTYKTRSHSFDDYDLTLPAVMNLRKLLFYTHFTSEKHLPYPTACYLLFTCS